jgi:hypothetical protein
MPALNFKSQFMSKVVAQQKTSTVAESNQTQAIQLMANNT